MRGPEKLRRAVREAIGFYWGSGLSNEVPALAWFLLASLVPLALGITALVAVVLGDYAKAQMVAARLSQALPPNLHEEIVQLILRTHRNSPLLILGSIAGMLWTSSGAVGVLERSLSRLVAESGQGIVVGKLRNIGVAAAVTLLVVMMVLVASAGTGLVRELRLNSVLTRLFVPIISTALTAFICGAVYWVLSGGEARWRSALLGGLTGGVLLQVTPTAAGYYLRYVAGNTPVELFLMLSGVLITCYLAALALLIGAGVTMRLQLRRSLGDPPA
ncbi:MAG: YihY/virulence factor BrkB family protein [Solirubrobacterales bacterium]|nr:YihY/virulence factor BrkB family protein [Solirubrobacterales bacterium]